MIEAIVGRPGEGKTLYAVREMLAAKKDGRDVIANFHPRTGMWRFGLWNDMISAGNCLCVIDEAHMWFGARHWHKNTQIELGMFQQHRKEGLDIYWIAQHEDRVDVAIRELTAYVWRCKRIGKFCLVRRYVFEDKKTVFKRKIFRIDPYLYQHYFTQQRIGLRDGEGYGMGGATAYAVADGAPQLGPDLNLLPNRYRLEWPYGQVTYMSALDARLGVEVGRLATEWLKAGDANGAVGHLVGMFVGPDGRLTELDSRHEVVAAQIEKGLFEQILELPGHVARGLLGRAG